MPKIAAWLKNNPGLLVMGFLFVLVFTYELTKISQNNSWDNWGFGSAQTMLTVRYWARDGFIHHKLLFLPAGYHPEIQVLDKPEFRFLADGISPYGLIGRRVYYTHYPPLYLVPYGLLAKLGVEDRVWFRLLALLFSFGSVFFMAWFFYLVAKRNIWIPTLAVGYYITSPNFLGYADSLSNIPVDDFLKWAILFLSFYYFSAAGERINKIGKIFVWIIYFILALSTYDSVFFVFFWLAALEYFQAGKIVLRRIFYWGLAPLGAFVLQMAQNIWYLGWHDAALDMWGTFIFRSGTTLQAGTGLNALPLGIKNLFLSLSTIGYFSDLRTRYALPFIIILGYLCFRQRLIERGVARYIVALAIAGLLYPFIIPSVAFFGYQGRQVAPALLLLLAAALWKMIIFAKEKAGGKPQLLLAACLAMVLAAHFYGLFVYIKAWPNNVVAKNDIEYWRQIAGITDEQTIIIGTENTLAADSTRFFNEYYADRLQLVFKDTGTLLSYMDKLYSAMAGRVNFLIVTTSAEYPSLREKLQSAGDYTTISSNIEALPPGQALISAVHK